MRANREPCPWLNVVVELSILERRGSGQDEVDVEVFQVEKESGSYEYASGILGVLECDEDDGLR